MFPYSAADLSEWYCPSSHQPRCGSRRLTRAAYSDAGATIRTGWGVSKYPALPAFVTEIATPYHGVVGLKPAIYLCSAAAGASLESA